MGGSESSERNNEPDPINTMDAASRIETLYHSLSLRNIEQDDNCYFDDKRKDLDKAWESCCYCPKQKWGIGVVVNVDHEAQGPRILQIVEDSPADKNDLRVGDMIVKINDEDVSSVSLQSVYKKLRGEKVRDFLHGRNQSD